MTQTANAKKEYDLVPLPRRTVKMEGNVAYIKPGYRLGGEASRRGKPEGAKNRAELRNESAAPPVRRKAYEKAARPDRNEKMAAAARAALKQAEALKQAKRVRTGALTTIFVVFVAFCALALLISRYAAACGVNSENIALQRKIDKAQEQISGIKIRMEQNDSLKHIEDVAVNEFGMTYPEPDQKVRLDMD